MQYRREIVSAMNWYRDHKKEVITGKGYVLINAKDEVLPSMIGTMASMISKSAGMEDDTYVMSMARNYDDTTKVSLRISRATGEVNLKNIMFKLATLVGGDAGGHREAAGAVIPTEKEQEFKQQALADASKNAKSKAETIAKVS